MCGECVQNQRLTSKSKMVKVRNHRQSVASRDLPAHGPNVNKPKSLKMTDNVSSVFRPSLFSGKCAIVTGGGTGIGKAITQELLYLGRLSVKVKRQF